MKHLMAASMMLLLTGTVPPARQQRQWTRPSHTNEKHGPDERNVMDVWLAKSDKPTPVLVSIHGGAFRSGNKGIAGGLLSECLKSRISVVAITHRLFAEVSPIHHLSKDDVPVLLIYSATLDTKPTARGIAIHRPERHASKPPAGRSDDETFPSQVLRSAGARAARGTHHRSVRNELAGSPSLLIKLGVASLVNAKRTAFGVATSLDDTISSLPSITAVAG